MIIFFVSLKTWSSEIYVSLYETYTQETDVLLSIVYEKENDKWKIRNFHAGSRRQFGKTFQQWLKDAEGDYNNSKKYSAFIKIAGAESMLKPAPFIEYILADSIKSYVDEIIRGTFSKDSFPIIFNDINSNPEIYSLTYQPITDVNEFLPKFYYKTEYSLEDVASLEKEVDIMSEKLNEIFPGIENQFSAILFSATKKTPISNFEYVEYYNLIHMNN